MRELPILFATDMVRANLEGRKTQTRRVVKGMAAEWLTEFTPEYVADPGNHFCPYGQPGDILWVRETWKPGAWRDDGRVAIDYKASPELTNTPWIQWPGFDRAPGESFHLTVMDKWERELRRNGLRPDSNGYYHWEPGKSPLVWRPSIHMPKAAARIFLQIESVRVQRLINISEDDASAEGIISGTHGFYHDGRGMADDPNKTLRTARFAYGHLWESINGPGSWDKNPWVWVIKYKILSKTGRPQI